MRQILCICLKYNTRTVMCKPFDQFEFLNQRRHSVLNDKKIKFLLRTYTLDMDKTLKQDPGCFGEAVARFKDKLVVFAPRPPTMAFTCPVY